MKLVLFGRDILSQTFILILLVYLHLYLHIQSQLAEWKKIESLTVWGLLIYQFKKLSDRRNVVRGLCKHLRSSFLSAPEAESWCVVTVWDGSSIFRDLLFISTKYQVDCGGFVQEVRDQGYQKLCELMWNSFESINVRSSLK